MTKEEIIVRLQELASHRGGHISFDAFLEETGLKHHWLRGQDWWSAWNNLLAEAGLTTRPFAKPATPLPEVVHAVAVLAERLDRWPKDDDIKREKKRNHAFPSLKVVARFRRTGELARGMAAYGGRMSELAKDHLVAGPNTAEEPIDEKVKGYVYLLRSGRRYKIGKSTDPSRRYREVRLELPDETHQVHTIATDDPAGIERYWHARFAEKRVRNTEFFQLDGADVRAFKRRKYQ
jgi:hypothetical protein